MSHQAPPDPLRADFLRSVPELLAESRWPADTRAEARAILQGIAAEDWDTSALVAAAPVLVAAAEGSAEPLAALHHAARWIRASFQPSGTLRRLAAEPGLARFLLGLFAYSPFLADVCVRNPEYVEWLVDEGATAPEKALEVHERELAGFLRRARTTEARARALCRYRRREILRLGARDFRGLAPVREQCRELSSLADACIRAATADAWAEAVERHGLPEGHDGDVATPLGFAVIAMGKLGGHELNYSSDVDLVFVYDREGQTQGIAETDGRRVRRVTHNEFFARVANTLSGALMNPTEEGTCWRVDARLRPDGASGALARSLEGFASYFAEQARAWERVAYQKARHVAGDPATGAAFERLAEAHVYGEMDPRVLLAEIARLKLRIDNDRLDEAARRLDIKRGPGGIREVEFLVAVQQILLGAKDHALRARPTLRAMELLVDRGALAPADHEFLREAYCLFRRVEHSLQLVADRQTQSLPADAAERALLGRRLGFADGRAFEEALEDARAGVRRRFDAIFHGRQQPEERQLADELLQGAEPSPRAIAELEGRGLPARESFAALRELAAGSTQHAVPRRAQRLFERFLPALLDELEVAAMPDVALRHMGNFMRAHRAITTLYELLLDHPRTIRLLVRVCGFGTLPARLMTAHPEWLDDLLEGPELARAQPFWAPPASHWAGLAARRGTEHALAALRRWKEQRSFVAACREILGVDLGAEPGRRTAALADACLAAAAAIALEEARADGGGGDAAGRWAILALGTYGTHEVHLCGDLDIALVHDGSGAPGTVDRLAQRVLSAMGASTPEGRLWPVDSRLRPDGASSPLAVPLARLASYYGRDAGLWEFQSLTRARLAVGDEALAREALDEVAAAWEARRPAEEIPAGIWAMRQRMEAAAKLPRWARVDLKASPGGLIDAEFVAQRLRLEGPADRAFTIGGETPVAALEEWTGDALLPAEDAGWLAAHYARVRAAQRALRLLLETPRSYLPEDAARRAALRRGLSAMEIDVDGDDIIDAGSMRRAREVTRRALGG